MGWAERVGVWSGLKTLWPFQLQPVQATFIHSSHSSVEMVSVEGEGRLVEIGP